MSVPLKYDTSVFNKATAFDFRHEFYRQDLIYAASIVFFLFFCLCPILDGKFRSNSKNL